MLNALVDCPFCGESFDEQFELTQWGELDDDMHHHCPECNAVFTIQADLEVDVIDTKLITKGTIFCKDCGFEEEHCECDPDY